MSSKADADAYGKQDGNPNDAAANLTSASG
jgi:hypothetical protein